MQKRGQAAMEFLMTYGWAILAVLITIAALAYFGVLNSDIFLPGTCTIFPGIACTDYEVTNVEVMLRLRNGLGKSLNPFNIIIEGCGSGTAVNGLVDGEDEIIVVECNTASLLKTKSIFKSDIDITYRSDSLIHNIKGNIKARVTSNNFRNAHFELLDDPTHTSTNSEPIDYWYCYYDDPRFCAAIGLPAYCTDVSYTLYDQDAHTGKYSLKNQPPTPLNDNNYCYHDDLIPIDLSKKYNYCVYYKSLSATPTQVGLSVGYYDASRAQINIGDCGLNWFRLIEGTPSSNWEKFCGTFGPGTSYEHPTCGAYVLTYLDSSNTMNSIVLFDDISLSEL